MRPEARSLLSLRGLRASLAGIALTLAGCAGGLMGAGQRPGPVAPAVNPAAASAAAVTEDLQTVQRLLQGPATEQADITARAQHDFDTAPTASHELRLALVLGTPGHPGANRTRAQSLLRELTASSSLLPAPERALAVQQLSQIDDILTLETENRRLQAEMARADREHTASAKLRLQAEVDENARLRRELEAARAKLDAISNIERSLNERKPGSSNH